MFNILSKSKQTENSNVISCLGANPIILRRSNPKPIDIMASQLIVLLALALFSCTVAAPVAQDTTEATTTSADDEAVPLVAVIEVIETVPVIVGFEELTTTEAAEPATHQVAKRSLLGDNANNDLLSEYDGLNLDAGISSVAGGRIRVLPSWVGK